MKVTFPYKAALAVLLCGALTTESIPAAAFTPPVTLSPVTIPASLGTVTDVYFPPTSSSIRPDVVLIQNLHVNRSVQFAISGILKKLKAQNLLPPRIAVEGATGPVDIAVMQRFQDARLRKQASDYLVRQGEMPGAMHFAITEGAGALYGVESAAYYQANLEMFRRSYKDRVALSQELDKIQASLPALKKDPAVRDNALILEKDLLVVGRLINNQTLPTEVPDALRRASSAVEHLKQILPAESAGRLIEPLSAAINFYALAFLRDQELFKNTLALRIQEHQTTSVLITGGFHTRGLAELCKAHGLSYAIITPAVKRHDKVDERLYVQRLLGNHLTPEQAATGWDWAANTELEPLFDGTKELFVHRVLRVATENRRPLAVAAIAAFWISVGHPQVFGATQGSLQKVVHSGWLEVGVIVAAIAAVGAGIVKAVHDLRWWKPENVEPQYKDIQLLPHNTLQDAFGRYTVVDEETSTAVLMRRNRTTAVFRPKIAKGPVVFREIIARLPRDPGLGDVKIDAQWESRKISIVLKRKEWGVPLKGEVVEALTPPIEERDTQIEVSEDNFLEHLLLRVKVPVYYEPTAQEPVSPKITIHYLPSGYIEASQHIPPAPDQILIRSYGPTNVSVERDVFGQPYTAGLAYSLWDRMLRTLRSSSKVLALRLPERMYIERLLPGDKRLATLPRTIAEQDKRIPKNIVTRLATSPEQNGDYRLPAPDALLPIREILSAFPADQIKPGRRIKMMFWIAGPKVFEYSATLGEDNVWNTSNGLDVVESDLNNGYVMLQFLLFRDLFTRLGPPKYVTIRFTDADISSKSPSTIVIRDYRYEESVSDKIRTSLENKSAVPIPPPVVEKPPVNEPEADQIPAEPVIERATYVTPPAEVVPPPVEAVVAAAAEASGPKTPFLVPKPPRKSLITSWIQGFLPKSKPIAELDHAVPESPDSRWILGDHAATKFNEAADALTAWWNGPHRISGWVLSFKGFLVAYGIAAIGMTFLLTHAYFVVPLSVFWEDPNTIGRVIVIGFLSFAGLVTMWLTGFSGVTRHKLYDANSVIKYIKADPFRFIQWATLTGLFAVLLWLGTTNKYFDIARLAYAPQTEIAGQRVTPHDIQTLKNLDSKTFPDIKAATGVSRTSFFMDDNLEVTLFPKENHPLDAFALELNTGVSKPGLIARNDLSAPSGWIYKASEDPLGNLLMQSVVSSKQDTMLLPDGSKRWFIRITFDTSKLQAFMHGKIPLTIFTSYYHGLELLNPLEPNGVTVYVKTRTYSNTATGSVARLMAGAPHESPDDHPAAPTNPGAITAVLFLLVGLLGLYASGNSLSSLTDAKLSAGTRIDLQTGKFSMSSLIDDSKTPEDQTAHLKSLVAVSILAIAMSIVGMWRTSLPSPSQPPVAPAKQILPQKTQNPKILHRMIWIGAVSLAVYLFAGSVPSSAADIHRAAASSPLAGWLMLLVIMPLGVVSRAGSKTVKLFVDSLRERWTVYEGTKKTIERIRETLKRQQWYGEAHSFTPGLYLPWSGMELSIQHKASGQIDKMLARTQTSA